MPTVEMTQEATPPFPQARPDIRAWTFFPAKANQDSAYVIGSEECDRYIIVPGRRLSVVQAAIARMDGTRSADAVSMQILQGRGVRMDVADLCRKLDAAGLLTSSKPAAKQGDIDKLSIRLGNVDISMVFRCFSKVTSVIPGWIVIGLCGLSVIGALALLAAMTIGLAVARSPMQGDLTAIHFAWSLAGVLLGTVVIHESAHLIAASYAGLNRGRVNFYLYMLVIPMVGLKVRGLYTLSPWRRFAVWSAGVFANFTAAALAVLLLQWGPAHWAPALLNIAAVNWFVGIVNLFPFLPTDGYYMLATLLRQMNIRVRAFAALASLLNRRRTRPALLVALYATANIFLLAMICLNNVRRLIHGVLTNHPDIYVRAAVILVGLILIIRTIWKSGHTGECHTVPATTSPEAPRAREAGL